MSKGRPTLFGNRLKPNGTSQDMHDWLIAEAARRSTPTKKVKVAELKRLALEAFRTQCELETPIHTFRDVQEREQEAILDDGVDHATEIVEAIGEVEL